MPLTWSGRAAALLLQWPGAPSSALARPHWAPHRRCSLLPPPQDAAPPATSPARCAGGSSRDRPACRCGAARRRPAGLPQAHSYRRTAAPQRGVRLRPELCSRPGTWQPGTPAHPSLGKAALSNSRKLACSVPLPRRKGRRYVHCVHPVAYWVHSIERSGRLQLSKVPQHRSHSSRCMLHSRQHS